MIAQEPAQTMIPAISQVCSLHSSFQRDIEEYAAGKCPAVEIWLTKLEQYVEQADAAAARRLFETHDVLPAAASFQGGLLTSQGEARGEAWKLYRRRLELCAAIGVPTIIVAADVTGPLSQELLDRVSLSLQEVAVAAGGAGIRVALEFQCRAAFINNLQTAAAVVAEVGSPHLGLCLDAFHFSIGCSKLDDLAYVTRDNLFHVQLCDLADVARELATDAERILPGDGDFPIATVVQHLKSIKYPGFVSVEVMNPQLWQVPPREFGEIATTALRRLLGLAESGTDGPH